MNKIYNNIWTVVRARTSVVSLATVFCVISSFSVSARSNDYSVDNTDQTKNPVVVSCLSSDNNPQGAYIGNDSTKNDYGALFKSTESLDKSHFTWGAEAGTSIDITAHDMSTFDVDVLLGYKNSFLNMAGIGVGVHRTIRSGDNFIPIYATLRSSFRPGRSLLFMNMRFGYSFNTIGDSPTFGDFNAAIGMGINLSQSRRARTYILLNLAYRHFNERHKNLISLDTSYVYIAQLMCGVNF